MHGPWVNQIEPDTSAMGDAGSYALAVRTERRGSYICHMLANEKPQHFQRFWHHQNTLAAVSFGRQDIT